MLLFILLSLTFVETAYSCPEHCTTCYTEDKCVECEYDPNNEKES